MSKEKPSEEEAAKVMGLYQKRLEKEFHKDWVARKIKNEYKETLLSRLMDLVKKDGDDEEKEKARKKIAEELKQRRLDFKPPKIRIIEPKTLHAGGSMSLSIGPEYGYAWSTGGSADKSGIILVGDYVYNASAYSAGGVGTWFNPPIAGAWTFQPTITYNFDWYVSNGIFGGAQTNAFFAVTIYTYLNGEYLPQYDDEVRYRLWYAAVGPGLVDAQLQNYGTNVAETPVLGGMQLNPEFGYLFWTWFGISSGAGPDAISDGRVGAAVSAMTFSCTF
jgi:hypothetical protein